MLDKSRARVLLVQARTGTVSRSSDEAIMNPGDFCQNRSNKNLCTYEGA